MSDNQDRESDHTALGSPVEGMSKRKSVGSRHSTARRSQRSRQSRRSTARTSDGEGTDGSVLELDSNDGNSEPDEVTAEEREKERQQVVYAQQEGDEEEEKYRRKKYCRLPLYKRPAKEDDGPWVHDRDKATSFLTLFNNLAAGTVLTVFAGWRGIQTPADIPNYFAYFALISMMWMVQLHYDVRFEANDVMHRLFKVGHVILYVYIGAASGTWDLGAMVHPPPDPDSEGGIAHDIAVSSFLTIAIALAVHRGILAFQYLVIAIIGHKSNRNVKGPTTTCAVLVGSSIFAVVAAVIPADTVSKAAAKVAMLYLGIFFEVVSFGIIMVSGVQIPARGADLAQQYSSLSLIILGLGFSNVASAFQQALSGIGIADTTTYALVFLVIGIMYNIWGFLFSNFSLADAKDSSGIWGWELIHFPLHFAILLLISGLINSIVMNSFIFGIISSSSGIIRVFHAIIAGQDVPQSTIRSIGHTLNRLNLEHNFQETYTDIVASNSTSPGTTAVMAYQYYARVLRGACQQANMKFPEPARDILENILAYNATRTNVTTELVKGQAIESLEIILTSQLTGVLWLFPAAGFVLILCALRSMLRYHFAGVSNKIVHGTMMGAGTCLALLGLLDIGSKEVKLEELGDAYLAELKTKYGNPMYKLVGARMSIAIVFIVYTVVTIAITTLIGLVARRQRRKNRKGKSRRRRRSSGSV